MWKALTGLTSFIVLVLLFAADQAIADSWARAFGGANHDWAYSVQHTSDGGYVVAGGTDSFGAGPYDFTVVKLSSSGTQQWVKTIGGTGSEFAMSVEQTSDGGYIVAGGTDSFGAGDNDFLVVKLDSLCAQEWARTFGGASYDHAHSVQQTLDGGYVVAGHTCSFGAGNYDFLVLKLNPSGTQEWARALGGMSADRARSVEQTSDGGCIVAGETYSFGAGSYDLLVVKLNSSGAQEWARTFGGTGSDYAWSVEQTSDGGYVVAGETGSFGAGGYDFLVLKLSSSGAQQWARTFGGITSDRASSVQQTSDGGYVVAGHTCSFGAGSYKFLVLKLSSSGAEEWAGIFGGASSDYAQSVQQTSDGGYMVAGHTCSFGAGNFDFMLVKIRRDGSMADDCPWAACSTNVTTLSLGADCSPVVNSQILGANCSPSVRSLEMPTEDICGEIEVEEEMEFDAVEESIGLDVFPSVGRNHSCVRYRIARGKTSGFSKEYGVSLMLYDMTGRVERVLFEGNLRSGSYGRDLDLSDLAPGIHFLRLRVGSKSVVRKIEVFR